MRLLLDTHVLLWATGCTGNLSADCTSAIADDRNINYVSIVSLWELSIKENIGKLNLPPGFYDEIEPAGYEILSVRQSHLATYRKLPLESHHDPFDRLLVAQALAEGLTLASRDERLSQYGVNLLKA